MHTFTNAIVISLVVAAVFGIFIKLQKAKQPKITETNKRKRVRSYYRSA